MSRRKQSKPQHFWSGEQGEENSQQLTDISQAGCPSSGQEVEPTFKQELPKPITDANKELDHSCSGETGLDKSCFCGTEPCNNTSGIESTKLCNELENSAISEGVNNPAACVNHSSSSSSSALCTTVASLDTLHRSFSSEQTSRAGSPGVAWKRSTSVPQAKSVSSLSTSSISPYCDVPQALDTNSHLLFSQTDLQSTELHGSQEADVRHEKLEDTSLVDNDLCKKVDIKPADLAARGERQERLRENVNVNSCDWASQNNTLQELSYVLQEQALQGLKHSPVVSQSTSLVLDPAEETSEVNRKVKNLNRFDLQPSQLSLTIPSESHLGPEGNSPASNERLLQIKPLTPNKPVASSPYFLPPLSLEQHNNSIAAAAAAAAALGIPWLSPLASLQNLTPDNKPNSLPSPSPVLPASGDGTNYPCKLCGLILKSLPELGLHVQEHCETSAEAISSTRATTPVTSPVKSSKVKSEKRSGKESMHEDSSRREPGNDEHPEPASETSMINVEENDSDKPQPSPFNDAPISSGKKFSFHSPWEEHKNWFPETSGSQGKIIEYMSKYLGESQELETLRTLKGDVEKEVGASRHEKDALNSSGETVKSEDGHAYTDSIAPSKGTNGTEPTSTSNKTSGSKHLPSESSRDLPPGYCDLLSKGLPGAYPGLPGFPPLFNLPLSSQWSAISKYSHVNGYMQSLMANPSMMLAGYGGRGMGGASTSSRGGFGGNQPSSSKHSDSGLACSYCGKVCPRPSILKRHMMMHTGERPFECKACGQRFRAKGSMLFHQKLRHNMDVKLNKALEERYLQIVTNQRNKQMREERKKAALVNACTEITDARSSSVSYSFNTPEAQPWFTMGNVKSSSAESHIVTRSTASRIAAQKSGVEKKSTLEDSGYLEGSGSQSVMETSSLSGQGLSPLKLTDKSEGSKLGESSTSRRVPLNSASEDQTVEPQSSLRQVGHQGVSVKVEAEESSHQAGFNNNNSLALEDSPAMFERTRGGSKTPNDAGLFSNRSGASREPMFTPEPREGGAALNYDDNSNLKDSLDHMIMNAFNKLGLTPSGLSGLGNCEADQAVVTDAAKSKTTSQQSMEEESTTLSEDHSLVGQEIEYPSLFPGLKSSMVVQSETVLVTRLEGMNTDTGKEVALYKCHLCQNDGLIFTRFSTAQEHLSKHISQKIAFYECALCPGKTFKFKTQLVQHMSKKHGVNHHTFGKIKDTKNCSIKKKETVSKTLSRKIKMTSSGAKQLYQSPFYSSRIKRKFGLQKHKLQPYFCQACQSSFRSYYASRRHAVFCRGRAYGRQKKVLPRKTSTRKRSLHNPTPKPDLSRNNLLKMVKASIRSKLLSAEEPLDRQITSQNRDLYRSSRPHHASVAESTASLDSEKESQSYLLADDPETFEIAKEIREKERLGEDVTVVIPSDTPIDLMQSRASHKSSISPPTSEIGSWSDVVEGSEGVVGPPGGEIGFAPVKKLMLNQHQTRTRRKSSRGVTPPTPGEVFASHSTDTSVDKDFAENQKSEAYKGSLSQVSSAGGELPATSGSELSAELKHKNMLYLSYLNAEGLSPGLAQPSLFSTASTPQSATPASITTPPFLPTSLSAFCPPLGAGLPSLMPASLVSPAQQAALLAQSGMVSPTLLGGSFSPFLTPYVPPTHPPSTNLPLVSSATTPTAAAPASASSGQKSSQSSNDARSLAARYPAKKLDPVPPSDSSDGDSVNDSSSKGSSLSRSHSRVYPVKHPVRREDACKPTVLSDGRTVYRCLYCNKDFATYSDVNRHMDFHEGRQDIRPYKCKYCDYYARTNSQLKVHMMRHQGIRDFHCKLCNYKGVTQSDLNRHMKSQIHTMKAQNACSMCGEGFVSSKNLERHTEENHAQVTSPQGAGAQSGSFGMNNHHVRRASSTSGSRGNTPAASPIASGTGFNFQLPLPP